MDFLDETGFFIYQTTKVRIRNFTNKGIEVHTYSKHGSLGFIWYCNLLSETDNLYEGKSLYVHYLGYKEPYLYFTEEGRLIFPDLV
ncbi:hypothetical protein [Virgibacillus sp. SK37]|uniref:hypothetical protein n=1 Tax=Virgibacillus sp. SK37 TaxID=403957 RepID=UPI0011A88790|nr:hypothetical protein [Virgibacillus sp. SK37]